MHNPNTHLMDQFYDLYSRGLETGHINAQDWQVIETVKNTQCCTQEQQEMLNRLLYSISKERIAIEPVAGYSTAA
ncbi:MAG: hypothetical protein F6J87_11250 [Spirulina sp. SIO3F2]|nr:hypothetical protein [Spirulina sp. SIO3F2]